MERLLDGLPNIHMADRAAFIGATGTGKTVWAKQLLLQRSEAWVVLDSKHGFTLPGIPIRRSYDPQLRHQIVRLPITQDEVERWQYVILQAFKRGNVIVYIDELNDINPGPRLLPALGRALREGRQRRVGVWWGSQRPSNIPIASYSECTHFFVFWLSVDSDRKRVRDFTREGVDDEIAQLRGHDFLYWGIRDRKLVRYRQQMRGVS
jgi:hypothetical protein